MRGRDVGPYPAGKYRWEAVVMDTDDDIGVTVLAADAGWEHLSGRRFRLVERAVWDRPRRGAPRTAHD